MFVLCMKNVALLRVLVIYAFFVGPVQNKKVQKKSGQVHIVVDFRHCHSMALSNGRKGQGVIHEYL